MRNSFISGSEDSTIIIWSPLNSFEFAIPCKWEVYCILKEHTNCISSLVLLTPSEDLIISGSYDKKIKFWSPSSTQPSSPSQTWICSQTIEEHTSTIFGLSINQEGKRLISCGSDFQILVMEGSNKSQWNIRQRIQVDQWGYRLSFINSHVFAFQPIETTNQLQGSAHIHIYIYNPQKEQFQKSKTVLVQGGGQPCRPYFPQQYIASINILLSKNGHYINLIRIISSPSKSDVECNLEQAINFGTMNTYGTMSDNGEFLITWDQKQNNIQILVQGGQQES